MLSYTFLKRFLVCFTILACTQLYAAEAKIGYIDSNRLLNSYKGKDILKDKLQQKIEKWEKQAVDKKTNIQELIKKLESQAAMLSDDARLRKQKEIEQAQIEYESFIQKIWGADGEAKQVNEEVMKPFIDTVNTILQKIGKEREYTIIFDVASTGVVYAKEGMDLTDEVVAQLNQEFTPIASKGEKIYFCIFKFEELSSEAIEYGDGDKLFKRIKAGMVGQNYESYELVQETRLRDAITQANIGKAEEKYTAEDAAKVGRLAEASIAIIGNVIRVGESLTVTCKVIDTNNAQELAQETAVSSTAEKNDLDKLQNDIVTNLVKKLKK